MSSPVEERMARATGDGDPLFDGDRAHLLSENATDGPPSSWSGAVVRTARICAKSGVLLALVLVSAVVVFFRPDELYYSFVWVTNRGSPDFDPSGLLRRRPSESTGLLRDADGRSDGDQQSDGDFVSPNRSSKIRIVGRRELTEIEGASVARYDWPCVTVEFVAVVEGPSSGPLEVAGAALRERAARDAPRLDITLVGGPSVGDAQRRSRRHIENRPRLEVLLDGGGARYAVRFEVYRWDENPAQSHGSSSGSSLASVFYGGSPHGPGVRDPQKRLLWSLPSTERLGTAAVGEDSIDSVPAPYFATQYATNGYNLEAVDLLSDLLWARNAGASFASGASGVGVLERGKDGEAEATYAFADFRPGDEIHVQVRKMTEATSMMGFLKIPGFSWLFQHYLTIFAGVKIAQGVGADGGPSSRSTRGSPLSGSAGAWRLQLADLSQVSNPGDAAGTSGAAIGKRGVESGVVVKRIEIIGDSDVSGTWVGGPAGLPLSECGPTQEMYANCDLSHQYALARLLEGAWRDRRGNRRLAVQMSTVAAAGEAFDFSEISGRPAVDHFNKTFQLAPAPAPRTSSAAAAASSRSQKEFWQVAKRSFPRTAYDYVGADRWFGVDEPDATSTRLCPDLVLVELGANDWALEDYPDDFPLNYPFTQAQFARRVAGMVDAIWDVYYARPRGSSSPRETSTRGDEQHVGEASAKSSTSSDGVISSSGGLRDGDWAGESGPRILVYCGGYAPQHPDSRNACPHVRAAMLAYLGAADPDMRDAAGGQVDRDAAGGGKLFVGEGGKYKSEILARVLRDDQISIERGLHTRRADEALGSNTWFRFALLPMTDDSDWSCEHPRTSAQAKWARWLLPHAAEMMGVAEVL